MIISHQLPHCDVHLVGQQPRQSFGSNLPDSILVDHTCHLQVASDQSKSGYRTIAPWQQTNAAAPLLADGAILSEAGQSAVFHTADCPAVILSTPNHTIALHAGRPAMTPDTDANNIIDDALQLVDQPRDCHAYITGAISGKHFQHDHEGKRAQVQPFLDTYGPSVFTDVGALALDLVAVITLQLQQAGVPDKQIIHDGACTYETPELTSHRRDGADRTTTNTVIVTKQ